MIISFILDKMNLQHCVDAKCSNQSSAYILQTVRKITVEIDQLEFFACLHQSSDFRLDFQRSLSQLPSAINIVERILIFIRQTGLGWFLTEGGWAVLQTLDYHWKKDKG